MGRNMADLVKKDKDKYTCYPSSEFTESLLNRDNKDRFRDDI